MAKKHEIVIGITVIVLIIIGICWYILHPDDTPAVTVPTTVIFGNPGTCMGAGMCKCAVADGTGDSSAVNVSFSVSQEQPGKLIMSFNLNQYQSKVNEDQKAAFDGETYIFPTAFTPTADILTILGLPANTVILPTSESHVTRHEEDGTTIVVNAITLTPNPPAYTSGIVIFTTTVAATPPGAAATEPENLGGIQSIEPVPPNGSTTSSMAIPVTFMPVSDHLKIRMFFSHDAMKNRQPEQNRLFPNNVTHYTFAHDFTFGNHPEVFNAQILQQLGPNARIVANAVGSVEVKQDMIMVEMPYVHD
ncbi:MAG: hypothetical protein K0Q79_2989 [Flavipsychrobacter sp.]|jgi:hypothetical protein|nr:hypothetical protein [Flavipsychrobacter sp.]